MKALLLFLISFSVMANTSLPDDSLYHLESEWKDPEAKTTKLADFSGDYIVLSMVFTGCAYACPMVIAKVDRVREVVKSVIGSKPKGVLASFDVNRDTPQNLNAYMKKRKLQPSEWVMLSPPDEATARELAAAINLSYKKLDNGDFSHSNMVLLLDKKGVVIARTNSLSASEEVFASALKKILKK